MWVFLGTPFVFAKWRDGGLCCVFSQVIPPGFPRGSAKPLHKEILPALSPSWHSKSNFLTLCLWKGASFQKVEEEEEEKEGEEEEMVGFSKKYVILWEWKH